MQPLEYIVTAEEEGGKIATVLRNRGLSTGMIRRLKQTDGILLEGQSVTVGHTVHAGQQLLLHLPETPSEYVKPVPMELEIVYEDDWILVVNKPSGVPIHPSAGHHEDSLAGGIAYYMKGQAFTYRPITRLDRYTSGLVLIAKNAVAAAILCKQIKEGIVEKNYYAVTKGIPDPLQGSVNCPIGRKEGSVIKRKVTPNGKPALTHYQVEKAEGELALVRLQPITGRTHQIRVHMAWLGCPLLYDFLYGQEEKEKSFLLQCTSLRLIHPKTQQPFFVEIPCQFNKFCIDFPQKI